MATTRHRPHPLPLFRNTHRRIFATMETPVTTMRLTPAERALLKANGGTMSAAIRKAIRKAYGNPPEPQRTQKEEEKQ